MGMLAWMQLKAASMLGNRLGNELHVAAREAIKIGATTVLGDRLYMCTIQRIFDKLSFFAKLKMILVIIW